MSHRIRPLLLINRRSSASVLGRAYLVNNGMSANPVRFTLPDPALSALQDQIKAVEAAEIGARKRTKGAAAKRDVERDRLIGMLETERAYVQTLCDESPDEAYVIIHDAGMMPSAVPTHSEAPLKVLPGYASGSVILDASVRLLLGRSGKKSFFNWQWTADGGKSFNDVLPTPLGTTTISGLTPLTMVGFRARVVTVDGPGDWTDIVTVLVQ